MQFGITSDCFYWYLNLVAMQKVKDGAAHILKHFWHCSSTCRQNEETSDEEALKVMNVVLLSYDLYYTMTICVNVNIIIYLT